jgi:hypothetical protein
MFCDYRWNMLFLVRVSAGSTVGEEREQRGQQGPPHAYELERWTMISNIPIGIWNPKMVPIHFDREVKLLPSVVPIGDFPVFARQIYVNFFTAKFLCRRRKCIACAKAVSYTFG